MMGLLDKEKCSLCGKEGRLLSCFDSESGCKYLCNDCKNELHILGLSLAASHYKKNLNFNYLISYQNFYFDTTKVLKSAKSNELHTAAVDLIDIVYNCKVICFSEYKDFMISSQEVYMVSYVDLPRYSNLFTDAFMVVLFTKNPIIPYYSFIICGKANFFSLTGKSKKFRESIFSGFEIQLKDLKYPVGKAKELRKLVKKDTLYDLPIAKETLLEWLDEVALTNGKFKPKYADRKIPKNNWAVEYFKCCGTDVI